MRELQMGHALSTIAEFTYKNRQLVATANQLLKAAAIRERFRKQFCKIPYRFQEHPNSKGAAYVRGKMSNMLGATSVIQPPTLGLENVFLELAATASKVKKLSVLIMFHSSPEAKLSPKQVCFLNKFHSFLWFGDKSSKAQRNDELMQIVEKGGSLRITRMVEEECDD